MSAGIERTPSEMWVLFDIDNGDFPAKNYMWWFTSRKKALEHKREQRFHPNAATLIGPFKYEGESVPTEKLIERERRRDLK